jgi:hypothetical protein
MARTSEWAGKVLALAKAGNLSAAIAQVRVAPTVKDLRSLQAALGAAQLAGRSRDLDEAVRDNIDALSAPRLHRAP